MEKYLSKYNNTQDKYNEEFEYREEFNLFDCLKSWILGILVVSASICLWGYLIYIIIKKINP